MPSFPVKNCKSQWRWSNSNINMIYKSFLDEWNRIKSFSHFQILTKIAYPDLSRKLENWLFLEFFFIHSKTVKVSQNDQIQMQTWFTSGFLMNGTELRSFSHFQILTWIAYSDLSRNLENWLYFDVCLHSPWNCKCQWRWSNSNINMIYQSFLDEWNRIKKF